MVSISRYSKDESMNVFFCTNETIFFMITAYKKIYRIVLKKIYIYF